MPPALTQTVFVVDDDPAMRRMIETFVQSSGRLVESYECASEFLGAYHAWRPGCLVSDVWMPQMTGLELHAALAREGCAPPLILISGEATVPVTIGALRARAVNFLEKPFRREELLQSVEAALRLDRESRADAARRDEARRRLAALTPRQREVVDLLVAGVDNLAVARRLNMSVATVESHRARVMHALGVQTLAELMRLAVDAGV